MLECMDVCVCIYNDKKKENLSAAFCLIIIEIEKLERERKKIYRRKHLQL